MPQLRTGLALNDIRNLMNGFVIIKQLNVATWNVYSSLGAKEVELLYIWKERIINVAVITEKKRKQKKKLEMWGAE